MSSWGFEVKESLPVRRLVDSGFSNREKEEQLEEGVPEKVRHNRKRSRLALGLKEKNKTPPTVYVIRRQPPRLPIPYASN